MKAPEASDTTGALGPGCSWQQVVGRAGTDRGEQLNPAQGHPRAEAGETGWDAMAGVPWLCTHGKRAEAPRLAPANPSLLVLLGGGTQQHPAASSAERGEDHQPAVTWPRAWAELCRGAGASCELGVSGCAAPRRALPHRVTQHSKATISASYYKAIKKSFPRAQCH